MSYYSVTTIFNKVTQDNYFVYADNNTAFFTTCDSPLTLSVPQKLIITLSFIIWAKNTFIRNFSKNLGLAWWRSV